MTEKNRNELERPYPHTPNPDEIKALEEQRARIARQVQVSLGRLSKGKAVEKDGEVISR